MSNEFGKVLPQEYTENTKKTYKTHLCNVFMASNKCPNGNRCHDAHSLEEWRPTNWDDPGMRKGRNGRWDNPYVGGYKMTE